MELINKYFSKEVIKNTLFCLLVFFLIELSTVLFFTDGFDFSEIKLIFSMILGALKIPLIFLMNYFFYRDFKKKYNSITLSEVSIIFLINYVLFCFVTFIILLINDNFQFSSYFIDVLLRSLLVDFIIFIIIFILFINTIGMWKIYEKAGEKGWASIIPFYNIVVLLRMTEKPSWWIILFLIPFVNIIFAIIVTNTLSKKFGKYDDFVFGLIFLPFIFYPILGFGDDEYDFD